MMGPSKFIDGTASVVAATSLLTTALAGVFIAWALSRSAEDARLTISDNTQVAYVDGADVHVHLTEDWTSRLCADARMVRQLVRYRHDVVTFRDVDVIEVITLPPSYLVVDNPGAWDRWISYYLNRPVDPAHKWFLEYAFIPGCGALTAFNMERVVRPKPTPVHFGKFEVPQ